MELCVVQLHLIANHSVTNGRERWSVPQVPLAHLNLVSLEREREREALERHKMTGFLPLASVLVFFTALKGASSIATTVEHVRHLKTTQPKEAWPKMVYQSVAFNSPPSVSLPQAHFVCSNEFITSPLRQFNARRFAWGTRQIAWYMASVEATVTWEARPDQRTWFRGRPHRTWKCSCPRVRVNLYVTL